MPACALRTGPGHGGVPPGSEGVSAARLPPPARPHISKAMTAAPRGPDLSFLNEEEARAIFEVLQRDSKLRRAEKDRVRYRAVKEGGGGSRGAGQRDWRRGSAGGGARGCLAPQRRAGSEAAGRRAGRAGLAAPRLRSCRGTGRARVAAASAARRGHLEHRDDVVWGMRVAAETALSHGCCSPGLLSFPEEEEEEEDPPACRRVAGRGSGLNAGTRETAVTGKFCGTVQAALGQILEPIQVAVGNRARYSPDWTFVHQILSAGRAEFPLHSGAAVTATYLRHAKK